MTQIVKNKYEFLFLVDCENGNPNGDPDMNNAPRMDPETFIGWITDVALKRRIRNYVLIKKENKAPNGIFVQQGVNMNKFIAKSHEETGGLPADKGPTTNKVEKARQWLCQNFFDVRVFGAVMSTGANSGQVRGPVQLTFAKSMDRILPLDLSITRMAVAEKPQKVKSSKEYQEWEDKQPENELRTFGRKTLVPYGLYVASENWLY
jgi:CRISPR-associated protein Csd2